MMDENQISLVKYLNSVRVNPMLNIRTLPRHILYVSTSNYSQGIATIRKCLK